MKVNYEELFWGTWLIILSGLMGAGLALAFDLHLQEMGL